MVPLQLVRRSLCGSRTRRGLEKVNGMDEGEEEEVRDKIGEKITRYLETKGKNRLNLIG